MIDLGNIKSKKVLLSVFIVLLIFTFCTYLMISFLLYDDYIGNFYIMNFFYYSPAVVLSSVLSILYINNLLKSVKIFLFGIGFIFSWIFFNVIIISFISNILYVYNLMYLFFNFIVLTLVFFIFIFIILRKKVFIESIKLKEITFRKKLTFIITEYLVYLSAIALFVSYFIETRISIMFYDYILYDLSIISRLVVLCFGIIFSLFNLILLIKKDFKNLTFFKLLFAGFILSIFFSYLPGFNSFYRYHTIILYISFLIFIFWMIQIFCNKFSIFNLNKE